MLSMEPLSRIVICLVLLALVTVKGDETEAAASKLLTTAITKTQERILELYNEWEVSKYPNFLKSCYMHKSSWETMQYKYMHRLLSAIITNQPQKFVISFTGRFDCLLLLHFLFIDVFILFLQFCNRWT